ncbi:dual specificity mitogen-activated protein kinase kinase 3 [Aplysia californica]|uniref:Dual specificity mitogen-activated protein kinase kinase 3 n=1 Tax=Aplysia californica TaxID=6500 RepID=A0ABM1AFI2_APLCA|nr:dual specificity mitogen-activated protein kinase kinase 3 [Aplysia californica]
MKIIVEEPQLKLSDEQFSPQLVDFVNKCLNKMPALRLSGQHLLSHPFLQSQPGFDPSVISQMVMSRQRPAHETMDS